MKLRGRIIDRFPIVLCQTKNGSRQGFALPMAFVMGLIMLTVMGASLLEAQNRRDTAQVRQSSGASTIVTDSAIARVLVELSKPENSSLLARNFDPINPETGQTFLGVDGLVNTGDETGTAVDEWTGHNPSTQSCAQAEGIAAPTLTQGANRFGTMGNQGRYRLLAYRYNPTSGIGTVLVEGEYEQIKSHVQVSISVELDLSAFPGVAVRQFGSQEGGVVALRGRQVLGTKGNIYFPHGSSANTSVSGSSVPSDANRNDFLDAIWSHTSDGNTVDTVQGEMFACNLDINIPQGIRGTNFGVIDTSETLRGVGGDTSTTLYQLDRINLDGNEVLEIDTTNGPVQIEFRDLSPDHEESITLRDNAKIVNVRTDGQPPQIGDVRLISRLNNHPVALYDQSCIQNVFLYSSVDELRLLTSGPGCPGGVSNFEGVVWAEAILASKNDASNRAVKYYSPLSGNTNFDTMVLPGVTSGISVPEDVSSLVDLLQYTQFPLTYRYGQIVKWLQVRL